MANNGRVKLVALAGLLVLALACDSAQGQRRRRNRASECKEGVSSDWRFPKLAARNFTELIDLGDGFRASRNCNTVDVRIPGAYSDTLSGGHARPLSFQLAAAVFFKVCDTSAADLEEAMEKFHLGTKAVRQGSGEVMKEYSFRLRNGRTAHIFTYFNDYSGLMGIVKTSPPSVKR